MSLPSHKRLFWLYYFGFRASYHNIYIYIYIYTHENNVTCLGTGDAVQFVNWFYYNLICRDYNYLLQCYLFTQLTRQSLHSIRSSFRLFSLSLKHLSSLQLFFTYELPATVSYRELLCSADGLQDNASALNPGKAVAPLLRVHLPSRCITIVTARTHKNQVCNS
jgi:hypothetical protein